VTRLGCHFSNVAPLPLVSYCVLVVLARLDVFRRAAAAIISLIVLTVGWSIHANQAHMARPPEPH
jgi:hypothetical protein